MRTTNLATTLTLALALGACTPPPDQMAAAPMVDTAAATTGVADLWQRWATAETAGDVAALTDMVADSVRVDVRGLPPIVGRAAFTAVVEPMFKEVDYTSLIITPERTTVVSHTLVYQFGSYTAGTTVQGKNSMEYGRFATAVRKFADGNWRLSYVIEFTDSTVTVK